MSRGSGIKRSGGSLKPTTAMPKKSQRRAGVKPGQKGAIGLRKGPVVRSGG